jgi:hypothetical protein
MPYVMDWPPKRILAVALVGLAMLIAAPVASANSSSSCPIPPSSQVFSQFGDSNSYSLVPGGDFQNEDTSGWTFNNASLVSGGEPWNVSGASENQSLSIGPGGSAISPSICVSNLFPSLRFFALNAQGSGGWGTSLRVSALWTDSNGYTHTFSLGHLYDSQFQSWEPTPSIALGSYLPDGMSVNVQLEFSSGANSTWQIDDVYVDPYAK